MKKYIITALAVVMLMTMVTGCGEETKKEDSDDSIEGIQIEEIQVEEIWVEEILVEDTKVEDVITWEDSVTYWD